MSIIAVQRALIILKHLAVSPDGVSVRDIAGELGYGPSVVQKSLQALVSQNFAQKDNKTQRYILGPAAIQVGFAGFTRVGIRQAAHPVLQRLVDTTQETALLGIPFGDHVIYIDKISSTLDVRVDPPIGAERPFNCTAVGKTIMAHMPDEELERLSSTNAFREATTNSIVDIEKLRLQLANIREKGYSIDHEEFLAGAMCIGAPIKDYEGSVVAAVALAGPLHRMEEREKPIVDAVVSSAKEISAQMGSIEGIFARSAPTPERIVDSQGGVNSTDQNERRYQIDAGIESETIEK